MENERDNAAQFIEYMCKEDLAFSTVRKQLGTLPAVLTYLRSFEWWLKKSAQEAMETKPEQHTTGSPKLPPSCDVCPFGYVCRCSGQRGCRDCNDAWRQLRAGA